MKTVWYVHRPTYGGLLEPPYSWRIEEVEEGSDRDQMLSSGRTVNDAGELVELPGEWWRFESRQEAEAWMQYQPRHG